jgi:hypothetical protein
MLSMTIGKAPLLLGPPNRKRVKRGDKAAEAGLQVPLLGLDLLLLLDYGLGFFGCV